MTGQKSDLIARVRANLGTFERVAIDLAGLRPAAVAVTLATDDRGTDCVLLTRRAANLRAHAGQWAFPGGGIDDGEQPEQAALRELSEEVGLDLDDSSVLGRLDDYPTRSGFLIAPVVVWGGTDPLLRPNPNEVASIHWIPLEELDRPGSPRLLPAEDGGRVVIQMPVGDSHVHAPTAAILYQLREVALHGRSTRVFEYGEPFFARR